MNHYTIDEIEKKIEKKERLSRNDGKILMQHKNLLHVARLANNVKEKKSQNNVYYVVNRQINPTNICVLSCKFCDFAAKVNDEHAYEQSLDEIVKQAEGTREVHIVGGLHPKWPYAYYLEILSTIRRAYPDVQIKAWTAVEVDFLSKIGKRSWDKVLQDLKDAGLNTMPGGGAEVFSDRLKRQLFPSKIGHKQWLDIHRLAHLNGIRTNATLLFGHIESDDECIEHMLRIRKLQDETHGFLSFIPLEYQVGPRSALRKYPIPAHYSLRMLAISRLMLDNVDHIKSYWVMLGAETAAIGLHFGANDMDGTIGKERIAHFAHAKSASGYVKSQLTNIILAAGRTPVERDALYRQIPQQEDPPRIPTQHTQEKTS